MRVLTTGYSPQLHSHTTFFYPPRPTPPPRTRNMVPAIHSRDAIQIFSPCFKYFCHQIWNISISPVAWMQTRDAAPAIEGNIVIITHTHIIQYSVPDCVRAPCHHDAGTRDAGGGHQGTKQSHSSLASPLYGHYGRAAAGRCREYLALSHTLLQFLCHSMLASVLLQSACNHTIVIGKIIDKMLSI